MILGVTGPRTGATRAQQERLDEWLEQATAVHHGACQGVDSQTHHKALRAGLMIIVHPPEILKYADLSTMIELPGVTIRPRKPYLIRDKDIVVESDELLALPRGEEEIRSGTWATIRIARARGKPRHIYGPDGEEMDDTEAERTR